MKAETYLSQLETLDIRIKQEQDLLERLYIQASGVGAMRYDKDRVQTSPAGDQLCSDVVNIVEQTERVRERINTYVDAQCKIVEQINSLQDPKEIRLLYLKYVEFKSIRDIIIEMEISDRWYHKIRKDGLKSFEKKYPDLEWFI